MSSDAAPTGPTGVEPTVEEVAPSGWAIVGTGVVAGIVGAAAATLVAALAGALDVPMAVAPGADEVAEQIPLAAYATFTMVSALLGTVLAVALARWAPRPRATFVVVAGLLTLTSLAMPLTAQKATTATEVWLELTHLVAAAIVIPALASRLPSRRARR
jgi:D-aminopeptidase